MASFKIKKSPLIFLLLILVFFTKPNNQNSDYNLPHYQDYINQQINHSFYTNIEYNLWKYDTYNKFFFTTINISNQSAICKIQFHDETNISLDILATLQVKNPHFRYDKNFRTQYSITPPVLLTSESSFLTYNPCGYQQLTNHPAEQHIAYHLTRKQLEDQIYSILTCNICGYQCLNQTNLKQHQSFCNSSS